MTTASAFVKRVSKEKTVISPTADVFAPTAECVFSRRTVAQIITASAVGDFRANAAR